jgi:hypothetical protein
MRLFIAAAISILALPATVFANPAWSEKLTAAAVDGPHIQLTYVYAGGDTNPPIAKFYGTGQVDWQPGSDTSADTGSGVVPLKTKHMCDCFVPVNSLLHYELASGGSGWGPNMGSCDIMGGGGPSSTVCGPGCLAAERHDAAIPENADASVDSPLTYDTGGDPGIDGGVPPTGTGGVSSAGGTTVPVAGGGISGSGGTTVPIASGGVSGSGGTTVPVATGGTLGAGGEAPPVGTVGSPDAGGITGAAGSTGGTGAKGGGFCSLAPSARSMAPSILSLVAGLALALWRRRRT